MATDALDPGPGGDYPYLTRDPNAGTRVPVGLEQQRTPNGRAVLVDLTQHTPDGTPIPDLITPEEQ